MTAAGDPDPRTSAGGAPITRDPSVAGRVVVVTGAGGGIGGAAARLLASLGAHVVITDVSSAALAQCRVELPDDAIAETADLRDEDAARRVIDAAVAAFGRLDGLVSAAGIYRMADAPSQDVAEARQVIDVNVIGAINIGVLAMAHMGAGSSIVNFTSGAQWGMRNMAPYAASKGAVASLTYAWALDLADRGVRVNAISPTAASGMTDVLFDELGLDATGRDERRRAMADPVDVAPLVAYLISSRSAAVNGQVVRLDRGRLSIVSRPAITSPVLIRPSWTLDSIAAAFTDELHLQPPDSVTALDRRLEEDHHAPR